MHRRRLPQKAPIKTPIIGRTAGTQDDAARKRITLLILNQSQLTVASAFGAPFPDF
jgi:hypothetical protein